jgi:hypothetical protein
MEVPDEDALPEGQSRDVRLLSPINFLSEVLTLRGRKKLGNYLHNVLQVIRVNNEPEKFKFEMNASPLPYLRLTDSTFVISAGLLAATQNEDELAGLLASELAIYNRNDTQRIEKDFRIRQILVAARGYSTLQRELQYHILVDLSVIDRMIRAGYNPWAYLNVIKRMGRWHTKAKWDRALYQFFIHLSQTGSRDYLRNKPSLEIRSSVIKNYILYQQYRQDLATHISKTNPVARDVRGLQRRLVAYCLPFRNIWVQRSLLAGVTYAVWDSSLAGSLTDGLKIVGHKIGIGAQILGGYIGQGFDWLMNVLGTVFTPVWDLMVLGWKALGVVGHGIWVVIRFVGQILGLGFEMLWKVVAFVAHYVWEAMLVTWHLVSFIADASWKFIEQVGIQAWDLLRFLLSLMIETLNAVGGSLWHYLFELLPALPFVEHTALVGAATGAGAVTIHGVDRLVFHRNPLGRALLENLHETRKSIQKNLKGIKEASDQHDTLLLEAWDGEVNILTSIKTALDNYPLMYSARAWNGLRAARVEGYANLLQLIDASIHAMAQSSVEHKAVLWREITAYMDRLPGYVFEVPPLLDRIMALRDAGRQAEARSPALRWEEMALGRLSIEYSFEHKVRLMMMATAQLPVDLGEQLDLIGVLFHEDMKTTALTLYENRETDLKKYVYSVQNKNPARGEILEAIMAAKKSLRTVINPSYLDLLRRRLESRLRELTLFNWDIKAKIVNISRPQFQSGWGNSPVERWLASVSFESVIDAADHLAFRSYLRKNMHSIQEMAFYIESEMIPLNAKMPLFAADFEKVIQSNIRLIRNREDLETLLHSDYFWPKSYAWQKDSAGSLDYLFTRSLNQLINQFPNVWSYEPASTERYHRLILLRLQELEIFPGDVDSQIKLWRDLTARGVSSHSDSFFFSIYQRANSQQKEYLEQIGLLEGRVWEQEIKALIAEEKVWASSDFYELVRSKDQQVRTRLLDNILALIKSYMHEGGWSYIDLLEKLSREIHSTEIESAAIHRAKSSIQTPVGQSASANGDSDDDSKSGDKASAANVSLGTLSEVMDNVLRWRRGNQWKFIKFLRGDVAASRKIRGAFRMFGPDRVKRMYDVLPVGTRAALLESFLSSPRGLIPEVGQSRYNAIIIDHLISGANETTEDVSRNLLESFLFALRKVGNENLQSYILAYLLAIPSTEQRNPAEVLKQILEVFGATGVKIGQFLAASEILPETESKILMGLQERANIPEREVIYQELREILKTKKLPFALKQLLGAASIKFSMMASNTEDGQDIVLKIFRQEAIAHTRLEFMILENMVEYLINKFGNKYAVLRSIIKAAKSAVMRELEAKDEVERTEQFRTQLYTNTTEQGIRFTAPREMLINGRLILSEYMAGVSFHDLSLPLKELASKTILDKERQILFTDGSVPEGGTDAEFEFDADRHSGNFRIRLKSLDSNELVVETIDQVGAIDAGQLHSHIPVQWRSQMMDLFAIAQILKRGGANHWGSRQIATVLGLNTKQQRQLEGELAKYFPDKGLREVAAYFSVLAAIDDTKFALPNFFHDFMKAIVALNQFEAFATKDVVTPAQQLRAEVERRIAELRPSRRDLTLQEQMRFARSEASEKWRTLTSRMMRPFKEIQKLRRSSTPPPPSIDFGEVIGSSSLGELDHFELPSLRRLDPDSCDPLLLPTGS